MSEFITRQRLAKLGFTSSISDLSYWKAQMFCLIDTEIEKWQANEMKKNRGK